MDTSQIKRKIEAGEFAVVPNKRGKSDVWKHFEEVIDLSSNAKIEYVQCVSCKGILKYTYFTGSSRLMRHAKHCRKKPTSESVATFFFKEKNSVSAAAKGKVMKACVKLCTNDMRPFDTVDGEGFLDVAQCLIDVGASKGRVLAHDVLPHRTTLSRHIKNLAETTRVDYVIQVNDVMRKFCGAVTTDMWTAPFRNEAYMAITCTFVDNDFVLRSVVLTTLAFPQVPKTGENIKTEILQSLENVGFDSSLLATKVVFVTDEGSNIISALRCFRRLTCACHLLNTALKHSYKETAEEIPEVKTTVENCKSLVTYLKKSGSVSQLKKTVYQEIETRWNTLCAMLNSINDQLDEIRRVLVIKNETFRLEGVNIEILSFLTIFLKRFQEASSQLEGDLYPTLHMVLLWYYSLVKHCTILPTDSDVAITLKTKTEKWLKNKIIINDLHKIATFLHPNFKSLKMLTETERKRVHLQIRTMMNENCNKESDLVPRKSMVAKKSSSNLFEEWEDEIQVHDDKKDEVDNYIELYMGEKHLDDKDLLSWWKTSKFSRLANIARRILCIPASSSASERVFSAAGRVLEDRRSRLNPDALDAILFLRSYQRL